METNNAEKLTAAELNHPVLHNRRSFIKQISVAGAAITIGGFLFQGPKLFGQDKPAPYNMILVDFNKCTGCRTCETACSANNNKIKVGEELLDGLGNPSLSNIRVYNYNPNVDVPITCVMCTDNPCIEACPVEPDKEGNKALYRDKQLNTIKNNSERCIGCGSCADACRTKRTGAIIPNKTTNKPEHMCTLCGGDPSCVKKCPYGAIMYMTDFDINRKYALHPDIIAERLIKKIYGNYGGVQ